MASFYCLRAFCQASLGRYGAQMGAACLLSGVLSWGLPTAEAQEAVPGLEELSQRVAALEAENARLQQEIRTLPAVTETDTAYSSWQEPVSGNAEIRAEIERYFEEKDAAAKAKEKEEKDKAQEEGYEVGSDLTMTAKWNNGLELSTKNKDYRVHIGGRTQFDTSWYSANQNVQNNINVPYQDGVDFRRARLRIDGTMYEQFEWAAEYDFVNAIRVRNNQGSGPFDTGVTALTDLWWTIKDTPWLGNIRIGNQKEQIGFEHIVSSRFLPFMERSYNQDSFYGGSYNGFQPGIQLLNTYGEERGCWALGLFKPTDNVFEFNATDGDYAFVGRLTRLLRYENEGAEVLHVGVSGKQTKNVDGRIRFRTRDAIRAGIASVWPIPADTGVIVGDDMQWINAELAAVRGPWTLQGEYLVSYLHNAQLQSALAGPVVDSLQYDGGYLQLLYFLTGEHDEYNRKTGIFERVTPRENFFRVKTTDGPQTGLGAWQLGARYNYLDLNDDLINGGILHNGTFGINWFLNPNMKIQANYMMTYRDAALQNDAGDGWINGWGIRFAHDF